MDTLAPRSSSLAPSPYSWHTWLLGRPFDVPSGDMALFEPNTGAIVGQAPESTDDQVTRAVAGAVSLRDSGSWVDLGLGRRATLLTELLDVLESERSRIAALDSAFSGVPVTLAEALLESALDEIRRDARAAVQGEVLTAVRGARRPVSPHRGAIEALRCSWTSASPDLIRSIACAFLDGTPLVAQSTPEAPAGPEAVMRVLAPLPIPRGVVSLVTGSARVTRRLLESPDVTYLLIAGTLDPALGDAVGAAGPRRVHVATRPGGRAVIGPGVDASAVADAFAHGTLSLGDDQLETPRHVVVADGASAVADALADAFDALRVGSSLDPATDVGPLPTPTWRDAHLDALDAHRAAGAEVRTARSLLAGPGFFVPPAVVHGGKELFDEAVPGPAVILAEESDIDRLVGLARETDRLSPVHLLGDDEFVARLTDRIPDRSLTVNGDPVRARTSAR